MNSSISTVKAVSATTAFLLAGVLTYAQAQDSPTTHPGGARHPGVMAEKMKERGDHAKAELGLTDAQKSELKAAREAARPEAEQKRAALRTAQKDLHALMQADQVDQAALAAKIAEVQTAQGALLKLRVDSALAMRKILTPEQQKKMSEMRAEGHDRRKQRRQHGFRGHGADSQHHDAKKTEGASL